MCVLIGWSILSQILGGGYVCGFDVDADALAIAAVRSDLHSPSLF